MLSAHQPFKDYPDRIKEAARKRGATAQVAGGVPAMCDGVTQGQTGMELSLFSRDVIALAAGVALSPQHLRRGALSRRLRQDRAGPHHRRGTFGYLPGLFVPAGPMVSGLPNDEKAKVRQQFAAGEVGRDKLMEAEMASYHGPGTCTFYGTANTNQMLMEFMGLHLPGASFVNPGTPLRDALTEAATERAAAITALGNDYPARLRYPRREGLRERDRRADGHGRVDEPRHPPVAMARAAGDPRLRGFRRSFGGHAADGQGLSQRAGGREPFPRRGRARLHDRRASGRGPPASRHPDRRGHGLAHYTKEPKLADGALTWADGAKETLNDKVLRPASDPFQNRRSRGTQGNLGRGVMKVSAVAPNAT
jgi:phosphogluconate dehydratase